MGDSISAAYGFQREFGWVQLLEERLASQGDHWRVVNASVSGETTDGGLARLGQALQLHNPAVVIVELGGNDGLRGYPIERMRGNLKLMVEQAMLQNCRVLLVGMQIPPNYGPRYTSAFYEMYAMVADETGAALLPFFLEEVALLPELMQSDGIHPTAEAQPLLLDVLWLYLAPLLAPVTHGAPSAG